jgi:hypothetical protein
MTKTNLLANVKESSKAHTKLLFSPVNQTTDEIKTIYKKKLVKNSTVLVSDSTIISMDESARDNC